MPSRLTPEQRSLRARIAAHTLHATHDPRTTSKAGRDAFLASFERKVDPDGALDDAERRRRAESLKRAYFARLAFMSVAARQRRTQQAQ